MAPHLQFTSRLGACSLTVCIIAAEDYGTADAHCGKKNLKFIGKISSILLRGRIFKTMESSFETISVVKT